MALESDGAAGPAGFDPGSILKMLTRCGVEFVLIGGLAAVAHGSPLPTADVDITPAPEHENLKRLSTALIELDARLRAEGADDGLPFEPTADWLGGVSTWNLTTAAGDLDIAFVPAGTAGYADLVRDAVRTRVFGTVVPIAALADVIRSKQAANRPKDQRVLPVLREVLARRGQVEP